MLTRLALFVLLAWPAPLKTLGGPLPCGRGSVSTFVRSGNGPASPSTLAVEFAAKVVAIQDGDTLTVLHGKEQVKLRLDGIDCPELAQPFGNRARQKTAELAFQRQVTVRVSSKDRYGRTLAVVVLPGGRNLNEELVRAGLAWWYRKYAPRNRTLAELEEAARDAGLGLWADPEPVPPWLWRKEKKATSGASQ